MTAGTLYIIATPIGNIKDITTRAVETLAAVDLIVAEDTRHSGLLLQKIGVDNKLLSYHQHNESERTGIIIERLQQGLSVALISDAGTPLISDPGFRLVQQAQQAGITISPLPGACAAIAALSVSGLASDHFYFLGFLPSKPQARQQKLEALATVSATLIFYESPHRIIASLEAMRQCFGQDRQAVIARELTKRYEQVQCDCLDKLLAWIKQDDCRQRGEFVVLVAGNREEKTAVYDHASLIAILLEELPLKQAVRLATKISGERKNVLYQLALKQQDEDKS